MKFKCHFTSLRGRPEEVTGQENFSGFSFNFQGPVFGAARGGRCVTATSSCLRSAASGTPRPPAGPLRDTSPGQEGVPALPRQPATEQRPPAACPTGWFSSSLTSEPQWGQQPRSPEILCGSNEISQFHKDFSGSLSCESRHPGGKGDLAAPITLPCPRGSSCHLPPCKPCAPPRPPRARPGPGYTAQSRGAKPASHGPPHRKGHSRPGPGPLRSGRP